MHDKLTDPCKAHFLVSLLPYISLTPYSDLIDQLIHKCIVYSTVVTSAVTVSIFGCVVSFGRYFNKNRGSGSVLVFIVPDFNHVQSKH